MDALDALTTGLAYRDQLPENDPGRRISDSRMMELINTTLKAGRPRHKGTITYPDPTGDQACARADRR